MLFVACVCLTLGGCKSDMEISHGFGAGVTFEGSGETFAWIAGVDRDTGNAYLDNPSLRNFVRQTIEDGFVSRGYSKVRSDPDFLVEYSLDHKRKLENYTGASFTEYDQGSLVVTVRSPESNEVVWWGGATAQLEATDTPAQRRKRIEQAVDEMMQYVPQRPVAGG
jgi:hypothetical protein